MASSTYWKLRRLAPRSTRVQVRRAADSPVIAAYGITLPPKATEFQAAYDAAARYEVTWKKEMTEGKSEIAKLVVAMRSWMPLLQRDIKGFDSSLYGDQPSVPDDVLEDAERLGNMVGEYRDPAGAALPYATDMVAALSTTAAVREWSEAEAADSTYQQLLARVRQTGATFDTELQAFRRTMLAVAGRNDKDYQKLRASRASTADADDDASAPAPPVPVEPAPGGATGPATP